MRKLNMRNKLIIFIFLQLLNYPTFSQEIEMGGTIIDEENKNPIEFVNIGIPNKNQGTISNSGGDFALTLSRKFKNDSLTISHINYHPVKIPIAKGKDQTISLKPKTTELEEVIVSNKKRRNKKIGVKSYNRLLSMRVISETNDIIEVAQRINIPEQEIKVKAINFNIRKWSEVDGVNIRINFYKNLNNAPGAKFLNSNIVREIPSKTDSGWIRVDLNNEGIYIEQDFFIGIEFIPNFKDPTIIDLGSVLTKGKGYTRRNSFGNWEKLNGGASINVETVY